jgi:hypothetical protein
MPPFSYSFANHESCDVLQNTINVLALHGRQNGRPLTDDSLNKMPLLAAMLTNVPFTRWKPVTIVVPHIFFGIHQIQSCSRSGQ